MFGERCCCQYSIPCVHSEPLCLEPELWYLAYCERVSTRLVSADSQTSASGAAYKSYVACAGVSRYVNGQCSPIHMTCPHLPRLQPLATKSSRSLARGRGLAYTQHPRLTLPAREASRDAYIHCQSSLALILDQIVLYCRFLSASGNYLVLHSRNTTLEPAKPIPQQRGSQEHTIINFSES